MYVKEKMRITEDRAQDLALFLRDNPNDGLAFYYDKNHLLHIKYFNEKEIKDHVSGKNTIPIKTGSTDGYKLYTWHMFHDILKGQNITVKTVGNWLYHYVKRLSNRRRLENREKNDPNVTEDRHLWVGGSDIPTILGINKYKKKEELIKEKALAIKSEFQGNIYTEYGNILEPKIRNFINENYNCQFKETTQYDKDLKIRANMDGFDEYNNMVLEIKTAGVKPRWDEYITQLQLYLWITGSDRGLLAIYQRPKDFRTNLDFNKEQLTIKEIKKDTLEQKYILTEIEKFWSDVEKYKN